MTRAELVDGIAHAIASMEGWDNPDARNRRNHNPGNLRPWPGCTLPSAGNLIVFPSDDAGWEQLRRQIRLNIKRGLSLAEFFAGERDENGKVLDVVHMVAGPPRHGYYGYAPKEDGNDPVGYAAFVADHVGIEVDTPLDTIGDAT